MAYVSSGATTAAGTIISINTGTVAAPTWTVIGEITDGPLSGRKFGTATVTNLQSTYEEFKPTIAASGDIKLVGNYVGTDAGQLALEAAFEAYPPELQQFQVELPISGTQTTKGDAFVFMALIEELSSFATIAPTKVVTFQANLKISGAITKTAGI